ncbi:hypothetical protein [Egicoccus halophilus]|uniref:Uncharacterized protein n=1 Tax=Egicoccus halophilus TaxID=1670830 RepID=A0A8J3A640_9ACTN|nr:hypothetical protein [Egicoccus halophilus]GGI03845.1 hypothetical protein GCM10011354_06080 [Egicoccus halophilus]
MMFRRTTTLKWGFRLGLAAAYLNDEEHGVERRAELLQALQALTASTRVGPLVQWLQNLNEGDLTALTEGLANGQANGQAAGQADREASDGGEDGEGSEQDDARADASEGADA